MRAKNEFQGKNVKAAIAKACKKLRQKEEELQYEILSHGSSGIFGLAGAKKAKIRIKSNDSNGNQKKQERKEENLVEDIKTAPIDAPGNHFANEDAVHLGEDVLNRIVHSISKNTEISVENNSERINFKVKGDKAAILIGKKGQTLDAIQLLVEKIINKHNDKRIRVQVDIEDYLKNRRENLRNLARRLSKKAKKLNKSMSLGQMNAADRRTVHLALKDDPGVRTVSRGNGYIKKIFIFPKD